MDGYCVDRSRGAPPRRWETQRTRDVPKVEPVDPGMGWMSPARVTSAKVGAGDEPGVLQV